VNTLINQFLATGREILVLEQRLVEVSSAHPERRRLGVQHRRLMRRQQAEIVAAVRAGGRRLVHGGVRPSPARA
jgi:hypothetical protein